MEHINELREILNANVHWNKTRITFFAQMLLALMNTRTVNLTWYNYHTKPYLTRMQFISI